MYIYMYTYKKNIYTLAIAPLQSPLKAPAKPACFMVKPPFLLVKSSVSDQELE